MKLLPPPGPERRRQVTLLAVLLVILAGVLWWRLGPDADLVPATVQAPPGAPAASQTSAQLAVPPAVRLDALGTTDAAADVVRNPFGFGQRQEPTPPGTDFVTIPGPGSGLSFARESEPQGPPPIPLLLTGLSRLDASGRTLVTLKDPSANVLHQAYEGDIVDGRYRVVKVGVQSVVVSYLDGSGMRTLPLGG
jgi:hypothetical protein